MSGDGSVMETEGSGATRPADELVNEDAYLVDEGLGLYVVCDGLGDTPGGEVAARVAIEALGQFIEGTDVQLGGALQRRMASRMFVGRAVRRAMESVVQAAQRQPHLTRMATTMTMMLTHGSGGVVGHVGDSRAYLRRDGQIHRLTADHEWAERLDRQDGNAMSVDTFFVDLRPGDTYILCTDGAERIVEGSHLVDIAEGLSPRALASRIVSAAHEVDPCQDATVVVVRVREEQERGWLWLSDVPQDTTFGHAVCASA